MSTIPSPSNYKQIGLAFPREDGIILLPADGRKGECPEELLEQWENGKAMKIQGGPYTSIRDMWRLKDQFNRIYLQGMANGQIWWIEV